MFEFSLNSPIIFALAAVVIGVVIAQSVFFLVKAYKRGLELGIEKSVMIDTIKRSAIFTIAPAVAIFMGVVSLVKMLGLALPWLRLSIIGAVTYELPAAKNALEAIGVDAIGDAKQFVTVAMVMNMTADTERITVNTVIKFKSLCVPPTPLSDLGNSILTGSGAPLSVLLSLSGSSPLNTTSLSLPKNTMLPPLCFFAWSINSLILFRLLSFSSAT